MTDQASPASPSPELPPTAPPDNGDSGGFNITRIVLIASAVLVLPVILIFIIALLLAQGNVEQLGPIIEIFRDLIIIFLALEGALIVLALVVLIIQIARLINLLQNEVKPLLRNTQETVTSAKGTVDFLGETVAEPVIRASAFAAGLGLLLSNLFGLRGFLRQTDPKRRPRQGEASDA